MSAVMLATARRPALRRALVQVSALAAAGAVLGLVWRLLVPTVQNVSDGAERAIGGEVAMAGLGLIAGVAVGVLGMVRTGPAPTARFLWSLVGSGVGSLVAWGVGESTGGPPLAATGVLVVWPLSVAAVTVLVTLVTTLVSPDTH